MVTYFNFLYTKYKCICKVVCFLSSFPPHTARRSRVHIQMCFVDQHCEETLVAAQVYLDTEDGPVPVPLVVYIYQSDQMNHSDCR